MLLIAVHGGLYELTIPQVLEALLGGHTFRVLLEPINTVQLGILQMLRCQLLFFYFLQGRLVLLLDVLTGILDGALSHRQVVAEGFVGDHRLLGRIE